MKNQNFALIALCLSLVSVCSYASASEGGKESDGLPAPGSQKSSGAIYKALNIPEQNITPEGLVGSVTFEKAVGGLECTRSRAVVLHPVDAYSCTLAADDRDDGAIYDALDVTEKNATPKGILGVGTVAKTVGNLKCLKRTVVAPHAVPHFQCILK